MSGWQSRRPLALVLLALLLRLFAEASRAVYTNLSGNQLIARTLFKVSVSVHS